MLPGLLCGGKKKSVKSLKRKIRSRLPATDYLNNNNKTHLTQSYALLLHHFAKVNKGIPHAS